MAQRSFQEAVFLRSVESERELIIAINQAARTDVPREKVVAIYISQPITITAPIGIPVTANGLRIWGRSKISCTSSIAFNVYANNVSLDGLDVQGSVTDGSCNIFAVGHDVENLRIVNCTIRAAEVTSGIIRYARIVDNHFKGGGKIGGALTQCVVANNCGAFNIIPAASSSKNTIANNIGNGGSIDTSSTDGYNSITGNANYASCAYHPFDSILDGRIATSFLRWVDDFIVSIVPNLPSWEVVAVGVGAGVTVGGDVVVSNKSKGTIALNTGTTIAGVCAISKGINQLTLGAMQQVLRWRINVQQLSTALEEFIFRVGFFDSVGAADATDGVYFEYDRTASANWRICTSKNGVQTKVSTTQPVSTGYIDLYIVVNKVANLATFIIGTTVVGTVSTNIPVSTGATEKTGVVANLQKTVGITNVAVLLDAVEHMQSE